MASSLEETEIQSNTPTTDAIALRSINKLAYQDMIGDLAHLSRQLETALRRIVTASDQFVADTGLKHGDLITDAVEEARTLLTGAVHGR